MFSKLLKYELKSVGKWYFALNASVIAISFFLGFSIRSLEAYAQNQSGINSAHFAQFIPIILALIFGVLVAGAWIATLVIIIRRFYKNVFGCEGYLTLTLPISSHQLILSKLLASFIWYMDCFQCYCPSNRNYSSCLTNFWCRKIFNGSSLLCIPLYTD